MHKFKPYDKAICTATFEKPGNDPYIGEEVTVVLIEIGEDDGEIYLQLLEYIYDFEGDEQSFIATKFVPVPNKI